MDAARLDGANPFQIFWRIMLPLARNGLLALGILAAIWAWNDLLWPLVVNSKPTTVRSRRDSRPCRASSRPTTRCSWPARCSRAFR